MVNQIQELIDDLEGSNNPLSLDGWVASKSTTAGCGGHVET